MLFLTPSQQCKSTECTLIIMILSKVIWEQAASWDWFFMGEFNVMPACWKHCSWQRQWWSVRCIMCRRKSQMLSSGPETPQLPLPWEVSTAIKHTVQWAHLSRHPKWRLSWFSHFRMAHVRYWHLQTVECQDICSSRQHLCYACEAAQDGSNYVHVSVLL